LRRRVDEAFAGQAQDKDYKDLVVEHEGVRRALLAYNRLAPAQAEHHGPEDVVLVPDEDGRLVSLERIVAESPTLARDSQRTRNNFSPAYSRHEFFGDRQWRQAYPKKRFSPAPKGRPKKGLAGDFLRFKIRKELPYSVDQLRACVRMRNRRDEWSAMYDHLALWIFAREPNRIDAGRYLECDRKQIDRAYAKGGRMTEQLNRIEAKLDALLERYKDQPPTEEEIQRGLEQLQEYASLPKAA
jgi:hypothetical protein